MHLQAVQRIKPMIKALSMVDDCKGSFVNIFLYYKLKVEGSSIWLAMRLVNFDRKR